MAKETFVHEEFTASVLSTRVLRLMEVRPGQVPTEARGGHVLDGLGLEEAQRALLALGSLRWFPWLLRCVDVRT